MRPFRLAERALTGRPWEMQLAPGVLDPISTCELALALGMTVSELGRRMSCHELTAVWPAYFAFKERQRKAAEDG